ncbi:MAG: DUF3786 domain-containing protein [Deltaproteobacteria bacterium]|jgi:hypothetical protein|nr:DUF3786 domain-containing protein [Deltaproteobacteria bacterium]
MAENPLEQTVFCPLLCGDLAALEPQKVVNLAGAEKTPSGFKIPFLGADHLVNQDLKELTGPPTLRPVGFLKTMTVLSYLIKAAQGPAPGLSGQMVGGFELPGGTMFFRGPHTLPVDQICDRFGQVPQELTTRALELGARSAPPAAFVWRVLPFVELGVYLDPADEEFPAQVQWTFDRHSRFYLALDGLWGLCHLVAAELTEVESLKL